jgi:DNA-binding NarL/FixJ family response regulator
MDRMTSSPDIEHDPASLGESMNILIVDDHPLILQALQRVLGELDLTINVSQTRDAASTFEVLARPPLPHLLLLDLTLPGMDGFSLLAELRRRWPALPLLVLSAVHDRQTVERALDLGAMGFIPKTVNARILKDAMKLVLSGRVYAPHDVQPDNVFGLRVTRPEQLGLTVRQSDVLKLLVQGKPNKLICRDLRLSEGTVKVHVSAILRALNVHTRTQVVIELARRGVRIDAPPTMHAR